MAARRPSCRADFEIAIICALPLEYDAVCYVFDEFWDDSGDQYGRAAGDPNSYTTGRIGKYNVVLALLPHMGKTNAASAAASMRSSYTNLRLALLVGVCGAMPRSQDGEILLGDVVISSTVIQFDFGRQYPDAFMRKTTIADSLGRPSKTVRNLVAIFETERNRDWLEERTALFLQQIQSKIATTKRRGKYDYPGMAKDKLFEAAYRHKHHVLPNCICRNCVQCSDPVCEEALLSACADLGCDDRKLVWRERKQQLEQVGCGTAQPVVHVGPVASGDVVMKSAIDRDRISGQTGAIAFEMEGAGVWDEVPSVIVKGVCDYADCHKNKGWQNYAAATAASVSKAILERYIQSDRCVNTSIGDRMWNSADLLPDKVNNRAEDGIHNSSIAGKPQEQSQDLNFLKTSAENTSEKVAQMLKLLEGLLSQERSVADGPTRIGQLIAESESFEKKSVHLPDLHTERTFLDDAIPLVHDLDSLKFRQTLSTGIHLHEGLDILNREDFRYWISMPSSGLLWVDGYEIPGRPSWLADFALNVVQASLQSGYETLFSFNNVNSDKIESNTPLALVQRYSKYLLEKYPEIYGHGDTDWLSSNILVAAKTDFNLSWKIFVECLAAIEAKVIYIIIEAIDALNHTVSNSGTIQELLKRLSQITLPAMVGGKVVKVILTSVKPDCGFNLIFETENPGHQKYPGHVLIRVSPALARSRKLRSVPGRKKRTR